MYRCYLPQPHCRHAGKRHGREKKGHFSQMPSRPKSLLNPGFGDVERGFAGFFPRIHPVLALVQHFGVLRELPSPRNRCLHRYGMAETPNCPFFRHAGAVFLPCTALFFLEVNQCLTNSIPSCAT